MAYEKRLIKEVTVPGTDEAPRNKRAVRTVSVNIVESPLGWLRSRGHLTQRQFDAGEQLRSDWEAAQLSPCVTMRWDPSPIGSGRGGALQRLEPAERQIRAKQRFEAAIAAAGSGLSDILWRVVCAGEGMREAETALGWPVRAGKLVLTLALDRVADHYRLR
ncbi:MAG TPA: DUF6456 domain-containing protein [Sphingomicrobium sp.]|jgi:hypothetical protein|nr:DUF6456 domain-containing protein [Sphingomicrobium sp.]